MLNDFAAIARFPLFCTEANKADGEEKVVKLFEILIFMIQIGQWS